MEHTLIKDSNNIATPASDLWVEVEREGHYQDMAGSEESEIVRELKSGPWRDVVEKRFRLSRPWLYSIITDVDRSAFLRLLSPKAGGRFLDVGSGWGQVALPLARLGDVFCLDLTGARLEILREIARQEQVSLKYICGNFKTFPFSDGQFDAIIFNGSLEYMAIGTEDSSIREVHRLVLEKARTLLSDQGKIYVGIENSLGLKYVLGAPDDHTNMSHLMYLDEAAASLRYSLSNDGAPLRIKTWSLQEYRQLFADAGLCIEAAYGCFPDYKLIRRMIPIQEVNHVLANEGLVHLEHSGVDGSSLPQNELLPSLYRQLGKSGLAEYFCPSYGFVARPA